MDRNSLPTPSPSPERRIKAPEKLWDPYEILQLYPNKPGFTCAGHKNGSEVRCGWFSTFYPSTCLSACKRLDAVAQKPPKDVTRLDLEALILDVLFPCPRHHSQHYELIYKWEKKISDYAKVFEQRTTRVTSSPPNNSAPVEESIETIRKDMEKMKLEKDDLKDQCTKHQKEIERLRNQQDESFVRYEQSEKRLKAKLKDAEQAKQLEIASLNSELADSRESNKALSEENQRTKEELQTSQKSHLDSTDEIQHLTKQLQKSQQSTTQKADEIQSLTTQIQESQQSASQKSTEIHNLTQTTAQLSSAHAASTLALKKQESTIQTLRESKTDLKRRLAKVEQQGQKMKREGHVREFRNAVQMVVQRARYEKVVSEKE